MEWLRHRRGGGRVYGNDSEVSPGSFLDRQSSVSGNSNIYSSELYESQVTNSLIVGAVIRNSTLLRCRTWGSPVIDSVSLVDVVVYDQAWVSGPWNLAGPIRIHAGYWNEPPRWDIVEGDGIHVGISECVDGLMHLGCFCQHWQTWFRKGYRERIGQRAGWSPSMIEKAFQRFSEWK